jgi:type IV secretory pathway TrbD component
MAFKLTILRIVLPAVFRFRGRRGSSDMTEGFEVPIHRALTEPILLGGAPRGAAVLNGTLAAAIGLGLHLWLAGLALWIVGHSLAVWGARIDPQFLDIFVRHSKYKSYLDV